MKQATKQSRETARRKARQQENVRRLQRAVLRNKLKVSAATPTRLFHVMSGTPRCVLLGSTELPLDLPFGYWTEVQKFTLAKFARLGAF